MLRLRRDESEARHSPRRRHDLVVVRVNRPDPESGKAEIFGETVNNVDSLRVFIVSGLENFGDADEFRRGEDGAGVDFVGDEVDVLACDEV